MQIQSAYEKVAQDHHWVIIEGSWRGHGPIDRNHGRPRPHQDLEAYPVS